jgi:hypothetical protein
LVIYHELKILEGKMKKILSIAILVLLTSFFAFGSGDHPDREYLTGSGFDLIKVNDVLVGTFGLVPIWAEKECGSHIKGLYKKGEENAEFIVKVEDQQLVGSFGSNLIAFNRIDRENNNIILKIGENEVSVHYEAEIVENPHLKNITFTFTNNETPYEVKLEGECCLGSVIFYSIFLYGITSI